MTPQNREVITLTSATIAYAVSELFLLHFPAPTLITGPHRDKFAPDHDIGNGCLGNIGPRRCVHRLTALQTAWDPALYPTLLPTEQRTLLRFGCCPPEKDGHTRLRQRSEQFHEGYPTGCLKVGFWLFYPISEPIVFRYQREWHNRLCHHSKLFQFSEQEQFGIHLPTRTRD